MLSLTILQEISGFLPVKTPLSQLYDACVPPECRFYPSDVFKYAPPRCVDPTKKIGMWINLTKTDRYYQENEACPSLLSLFNFSLLLD